MSSITSYGTRRKTVGGMPPQLRAWNSLVAQVRHENPHLSFKECLQVAKKLYRR